MVYFYLMSISRSSESQGDAAQPEVHYLDTCLVFSCGQCSTMHNSGRPPVLAVRFYLLVLGQILATRASIYGRFHLDVSAAKYRTRTEAEESRVESSERRFGSGSLEWEM